MPYSCFFLLYVRLCPSLPQCVILTRFPVLWDS